MILHRSHDQSQAFQPAIQRPLACLLRPRGEDKLRRQTLSPHQR